MQSTVKKANISHQNVFLSTVFEECLKCYSDVCFEAFNMFWNIEWENLDIHWKEQNRNTHLKKKNKTKDQYSLHHKHVNYIQSYLTLVDLCTLWIYLSNIR